MSKKALASDGAAQGRRLMLTPDEQAMVNANVGLVKYVLAKYRTPTEEWDDAYQDGLIGLMRAVQKFDPAKGFKFSTYAVWWIRQGIQRGRGLSIGLDYRSAVRRRVQYDPPLSLARPIDDTEVDLSDVVAGSEDPAGEVSSDQVAAQLMHMSMRLCRDDLDRAVMLAVAQGYPLKALATEFGVSTNTPIVRWRRIKSRMCHPTMRNQTRETA